MKRRRLLGQTFRHPRRIREIVGTFVRHGLWDWLELMRLDRIFPFVRRLPNWRGESPRTEQERWRSIRNALEELGPTFIKLGQIVSNRTDLLPGGLVQELTHLQDDVPPFTSEAARRIIEEDLGVDLGEIFDQFADTPQASASIAQVHRARLKDGATVAVKVQRPDIEEIIATDVEIISVLAALAERYIPRTRLFSPVELVDEFRRTIELELDFTTERENTDRFRDMYHDGTNLYVPKTYRELSSPRVITMEYIHGARLSEVVADTSGRWDKTHIARKAADMMLEQIYVKGFFHADPHPGNVLILGADTICLLDFGIMGRVRPRQREYLSEMMIGSVNRDPSRVTDAMLRLTHRGTEPVSIEALEDDIYDLIDHYADIAFGDIDITGFLSRLIQLVVRHGLKIPSNLMLITKTLLSIEGLGVNLSPQFDFLQVYEPFARKLLARRFEPKHLLEEAREVGQDFGDFLRDFPLDARDVLKQVKGGKLKLGFRVTGLEPLRNTLDTISYRLVFGLLVASLLVSSSLVIQAGVPPFVGGISVFGLVGYGIAGVISVGFLVAIAVRVFRR
ncbi:MAG: ABC1 kinase family protein [Spirochaetaceae bacterium]